MPIICAMPECQTSAGCKCNKPSYMPTFAPSVTDQWYNKQLEAMNATIECLRLSISEARATGRRDGMEEAAKIARLVDLFDGDRLKNGDPRETCAAAIRAAMEK